jgi:alpha-glucosidase
MQEGVEGSTLELYKQLIAMRKQFDLGSGDFRFAPEYTTDTSLAYLNNQVLVMSNFGPAVVSIPAGEIIASSQVGLANEGSLEANQTVWIKL